MRIRPFVLVLAFFFSAFLAAQAAAPAPERVKELNAVLGDRARVQWNPLTGTPSLVDGIAVPLAGPLGRETIEARTREFLAKLAPVQQVDVRDLILTRAEIQAPKNPGAAATWYVAYRQTYRGLQVLGGSVRVVVSGTNVVSMRAEAYPGIDRSVVPGVSLESALSAVAPPGVRPVRQQLLIAPRREGSRIVYHLAWEIVMPVEKAPYGIAVPRANPKDDRLRQLVPAQWRYLVDADTRAVLERRNVIDYDTVQGTVTGLVHPRVPADGATALPIASMTVQVQQGAITLSADTDATGTYQVTGLATGTGTLNAHLTGPHVEVFNDETPDPDATHTATVTAPSTHDWNWSADDPSPNSVETNAFHHANFVRDWFLRGAPFDVAGMPDPMPVHVRNGPYCNAASGDFGLAFGSGGGVCLDLALCADIIYHEFTHRIVNAVYASSAVYLYGTEEFDAMNEGLADFFGSSITNDPAQGAGCIPGGENIDTPNHRYPDDWVGEPHGNSVIFSGALWDLRAVLPTDYVDSLAMRAMKRTPAGYSDYLAAVLEEDDNPAYSTDPIAADNDPLDGTPNIDAICHSYFDLHGIFHPYCTGHTATPVAIITAPDPLRFNLAGTSSPSVAIEGSALAGTSPFSRYALEYIAESAPATWLTAGVTLTGSGTSPVSGGTLGTLALAGLADGVYRIRLTVFDASGASTAVKTSISIDRSIKAGWPQASDLHFFGTPAVANIDPAVAGNEIIAAGSDGMLYAWHSDGTPVPGWPQSIGSPASSAAIADLDGDGTLEVVIANYSNVFAFHQDGTAVAGWPTSPGANPILGTPALADLDGDGKLEIIAASQTQVFAWHADGTLVAGWPVTPGPQMYGSPAVGDLDGDGLPEIVIGTQDGRVFAWHADATPVAGWPQAVPGVTEVSSSVALGDLDGDGRLEVIAAGSNPASPSSARVIAWHADGTVVPGWPRALLERTSQPASVGLADVDGDGVLDVVVMTNDDAIQVFRADGTNLAGWPVRTAPYGGYPFMPVYEFTPSSPSIGDLDGDGNMEVIAEGAFTLFDGNYRSYKVYAYHHDGTAVAGWPKALSSKDNSSPVVADVDGDGHTDVIVGSDGVFVWGLMGTYDKNGAEWPTYRGNNRRTGTYLPKAGVVLLFDTSGSMSWTPDGTSPAPVAEQRISLAQQAAIPFLEEMNDFNAGKARFGIATFPNHPSVGCNGQVVTPMNVITDISKNTAITTTIPGLATENNTPLLAGMATAAGMLEGHRNAAIVLLTDGYHNCPTLATIGDPSVTALIANLNAAAIRVFSIGFGRPTDPDYPLLQGLADGTTPPGYVGSQFYDVTTPGFDPATWTPATALQGTYKSILVDALGLQAAIDPLAVIAGGATASHSVHLNEHDRRVSFFLSWKTAQLDRLQLTVRASDGSIVPTVGGGVRSHLGETYAILTVDSSFLRIAGKLGASPWTLEVRAARVPAGKNEPYQYSVIVDSPLRFEPKLGGLHWFAGERFLLTARLTEAGKLVKGRPDVRVNVTRPSEGPGDWLARQPVTPEELRRIPEKIGSEPMLPFQRKAIYLEQIRKVNPPAPKFGQSIRLYDDGTHGDVKAGDGIYSAEIATTQPGVYSFHFHAAGQSAKGLGFDRDRLMQKYVAVNALPQLAKVDVVRLDARRVQIIVKPQDAHGNLLGPGHLSRLRVSSAIGKPEGALVDALDGTYRQMMSLPEGPPVRELKLSLSIDGAVVNLEKPVGLR